MPDFEFRGKKYFNPVEFSLDFIGGAWKIPVLWRLREKTLRYSEIKKTLSHISDKMLAQTLRELEENGYIDRKVYPVVPPKTEYTMTAKGRRVIPVIISLREYGLELMKEYGIDTKQDVSTKIPIGKPRTKKP